RDGSSDVCSSDLPNPSRSAASSACQRRDTPKRADCVWDSARDWPEGAAQMSAGFNLCEDRGFDQLPIVHDQRVVEPQRLVPESGSLRIPDQILVTQRDGCGARRVIVVILLAVG